MSAPHTPAGSEEQAAMADELKPCPFCDGKPTLRETVEHYPAVDGHPAGSYPAWFHVACDACGIEIGEEYQSAAVDLWNRRSLSGESAASSEAQPIGWYEAEESCRGLPLRQLLSPLGQCCHSGRLHWTAERPNVTNPVWPLYASSAMGDDVPSKTDRADARNAPYSEHLCDALCATCGKGWGYHFGRCCDEEEGKGDRRFVLAASPSPSNERDN